jgi:serine beta-lactamase-like protein LACTB, mitochondrial
MEFTLLFSHIYTIPEYNLLNITREETLKKIDQTIENFMKNKGSVGLALGINKNGQNIFNKGYGFQDRENKIKITTDKSLFRWASMSKMVTSLIALKLFQEGKLNLHQDIKDHFQNFKIHNKIIKQCSRGQILFKYGESFYPCMSGYAQIELNGEDHKNMPYITPMLLLSNRSGICSYDNTPFKACPTDEEMKNNSDYHTKEFHEFLDHFFHIPLVNIPGEEYNYTTFGFNLMGGVLERSTGQMYMDLVNFYIKNNSNNYLKSLIPDRDCHKHLFPDRCKGYKKGKLTDDTDVSFKLPGGGFMSNLEDALDFCVKVSKMSTFEKLYAWSKTDPFSTYGMGFMVWELQDGDFAVGHTGGQQKASTFLQYYPKNKICLVALSNDEDFPQKEFRNLLYKQIVKL